MSNFKISKKAKRNLSKNDAIDIIEDLTDLLSSIVKTDLVYSRLLSEVTDQHIITPDLEEKKRQFIQVSETKGALSKRAAEYIVQLHELE